MRSANDEGSLAYHGWRVVLVCFVMAVLCWGFGFYGHAFYLAELKRLHGWSSGLISSATTAYYLASALLVVFVNDAIGRFGARNCVLSGALTLAVAVALLPAIAAPWQLFAVYLLMTVSWATMSVGAITNILGLWFDHRRGLAISLALNGASLGGVVIVPMLVLIASAAGVLVAMLSSAVLILALLGPLAFAVLGTQPPYRAERADERPTAVSAGERQDAPAWTRRLALRSPAFWSVSAPFAVGLFSQAGFLVHQIAFLEPAIGRHQAAIAVAITAGMAVVGRLALGTVAGRVNQRLVSALSLASQALAFGLMLATARVDLLFAACAIYGFSVGNLITLPALIIQREFASASFGMLIGLSTAISQFTYAFGPGLLGLIRDATSGYTAPLLLCIVLNVIAAAIVLMRPGRGISLSARATQ